MLVRRLPRFLGAVRFHETVFALPFAYTGMVLAAADLPTWSQFWWITVAMVGARTLGMSANRLVDRRIDARNPRTADRHLPAGSLSTRDMAALALVSLAVFLFAAARLNLLALALAPVAAAYLIAYPYAKRFTWAANLLLGWALAIAPSGAWIGVRGSLTWEPVLLSFAVASWAGSFDIIYHVQDRDFYVKSNLRSIPQRFGIPAAFRCARALDGLAIASLVALGFGMDLRFPYFLGCTVAGALLAARYRLVSPTNTSRISTAFFRINAYVSAALFIGALAAVLID